MIIGVDIDDTLTNTVDYFQPMTSEFLGISVEEMERRHIDCDHFPPESQDRYHEFAMTYFDRCVPDTTFKEDAAWGIRRLHEMGHKIVIITARSTAIYRDPMKATLKELENGGIEYDGVFCDFDKASVCLREGVSLHIDDSVKNCNAVREVGVRPLLFTSRVNLREETDLPRVGSWKEVIAEVEKMTEN